MCLQMAILMYSQGEVEKAMAMYQELNRWEDAIAVAAARVQHYNLYRLFSDHIHLCPFNRAIQNSRTCAPTIFSGFRRQGKRRRRVN